MIKRQFIKYAAVLVLALTLSVVDVLLLTPASTSRQQTKLKEQAFQTELAKQLGHLDYLKKQAEQKNLIDHYFNQAIFYLPENQSQNDLILQLDEGAKAGGISQNSLALEDPQKDQVGFSIAATGSYQSVIEFVKNLKQTLRLITLSSVTLQAGEEGTGLNIKGQAYFEPLLKTGQQAQEKLSSDVKLLDELKHFGDPIKPEEFTGGSPEPFGSL